MTVRVKRRYFRMLCVCQTNRGAAATSVTMPSGLRHNHRDSSSHVTLREPLSHTSIRDMPQWEQRSLEVHSELTPPLMEPLTSVRYCHCHCTCGLPLVLPQQGWGLCPQSHIGTRGLIYFKLNASLIKTRHIASSSSNNRYFWLLWNIRSKILQDSKVSWFPAQIPGFSSLFPVAGL